MNAFEKYGFDAMGIFDADELNHVLIAIVREIFGGDSEQAYTMLADCLDEIYSKAERITEGHISGSKMFTTICGTPELTQQRNELTRRLFSELSSRWHYNLTLDGDIMRSINA